VKPAALLRFTSCAAFALSTTGSNRRLVAALAK
jgi:hypothetical protein